MALELCWKQDFRLLVYLFILYLILLTTISGYPFFKPSPWFPNYVILHFTERIENSYLFPAHGIYILAWWRVKWIYIQTHHFPSPLNELEKRIALSDPVRVESAAQPGGLAAKMRWLWGCYSMLRAYRQTCLWVFQLNWLGWSVLCWQGYELVFSMESGEIRCVQW